LSNEILDVSALISDTQKTLGLNCIAGKNGLNRAVKSFELQRPGLIIAGYINNMPVYRIQVIGEYEAAYLESLSSDKRKENFRHMISFDIPCIIFAKNIEPPAEFIELGDERNFPVITTRVSTYKLISALGDYLEDKFAPKTVMHGAMVDVHGVGILFRGKSGIGKSECALDLIARGHRLVADDYVVIKKRSDDILMAMSKEHMGHFMEIRGMGIIDIEKLFGIRAVRMQKRVELCVKLVPWDDINDYERIGDDVYHVDILGVSIPEVTLPISPGKEISTLSEVIAMNFMCKVYGENPSKAFLDRLQKEMERKQNLKEYLRKDFE